MTPRRIVILILLLGLLVGGWFYVTADGIGEVDVPKVEGDPDGRSSVSTSEPVSPWQKRRARLHEARRLWQLPALDEFVGAQRLVVAEAEDASARGRHLGVLAEALLERVYCRNSRRGMTPGEALYGRVPSAIRADVKDGLAALEEARGLGVALGDGYRVEAGLRSSRITGRLSAIAVKGKVNGAYKRALELDRKNPRLHVGLGCLKMLSPRYMGQDLDKAMEHFVYACSKLPRDERPRIFAAMAAYLAGDEASALQWAERGVAINGNNAFSRAVLERLRAGETDPFGRDI